MVRISSRTLAYFFAIIHTLITGLSFLFTKTALTFANPIHVLAFRFTASLIALIVLILFQKIHLNYTGKDLRKVFVLALIYPLAFFSFQTFGLVYATSSEGGILLATTPIFTMILASIFFNEKTTFHQKASIFLTVIGVMYIFIMTGVGFDFTKGLGITLLLLSALSSAGYHILTREIRKQFSITEISFMMTLLGFIFFNTFSVIEHFLKGNIKEFFMPLQNTDFIVSILYLGILSHW